MKVSFIVPRKPVSVNASYKRVTAGGKNRLASTDAHRAFKGAVFSNALAARPRNWPKLESIKRVRVEITAWNSRHDADAPSKVVLDGMERILYVNDKVVKGPQALTVGTDNDGGEPRVEITVEVLEVVA